MHQKKKIGKAVLVALFFLVAGVWYVLAYHTDKEKEAGGPKSVFSEKLSATVTPSPTVGVSERVVLSATPSAKPEEDDEPRLIYVYVCGAVNSPGVYELTEGARLHMAVERAGGFCENADMAYHNLARSVRDGERVYVLTRKETEELTLSERIQGEPEPQASEGAAIGGGLSVTTMVNINTAGVSELTTLPGIGEAKAESIIEYRTKVGRFTEIEEIQNISGIGEAMFEKIKDRITVK